MFNRFHYDYYQRISETWYAIFQELDITKYSTICEIMPGWSPKIAIPLTQIAYAGDLILIDKQKSFLDELEDGLAIFHPKFRIQKIDKSILDDIDIKTDILVANHTVDDLILDYYCEKKGIDVDNLYNDGNKFVEIRKELEKDDDIKEYITEILVSKFDSMININGYLLLAQYAGETEKNFGLDISIQMCQDIVNSLKNKLLELGFEENLDIKIKAYSGMKTYFFASDDLLILYRKN